MTVLLLRFLLPSISASALLHGLSIAFCKFSWCPRGNACGLSFGRSPVPRSLYVQQQGSRCVFSDLEQLD
jgi:hypothetical protein